MERVWSDSSDTKLKSAFRNLKSAILLCAMLFALCFSADAQQTKKVPQIGYLGGATPLVILFEAKLLIPLRVQFSRPPLVLFKLV